MALANRQTTQFFTEETQMVMVAATHERLQEEGIAMADDSAEFHPEDIEQVDKTLRKPVGCIVDPDNDNAMIPTPPFQFGACSIEQLPKPCHLV